MILTPSLHSHDRTHRRLLDAIERRSLTVFARIDHAATLDQLAEVPSGVVGEAAG
jgi:uncharacterized protein (DUF302 family)